MQHFLISMTKGLETATYSLNLLLTVCYTILAVGCVTTYLYHTSHRLFWGLFLLLLTCSCIGYLALNIVKQVLMSFILPENLSAILPPAKAEKRKAKIENKICGLCTISIFIIGIIMVPYSQTFTGDPWWVTVHSTSMFWISVPFGFGTFLQPFLYDSILRGTEL